MSKKRTLSRRRLLRDSAAAAAGGAALLAQVGTALGQAPAVVDAAPLQSLDLARRRARAHDVAGSDVAADRGPPSARAHRSDESLLHARAGRARLGPAAASGAQAPPAAGALAGPPSQRRINDMAVIQGHGGVGIVEAVGRKSAACKSAIASACRARRTAAPATGACAAAPTCVSS